METITHRELRNDSAKILARVAAGESFEVTNRGKVVALISPVVKAGSKVSMERLVAEGRVTPAKNPDGKFDAWRTGGKPSRPTQEILDELREDKF